MATFSKMTVENGPEATRLLRMFLQMDMHYLDSSAQYGDGGDDALDRAIALFLSTEHLGFIWMGMEGFEGIGVCVVSLAISTSAGSLVAKLDDVYVVPQWQGKGMGTALMTSLVDELKRLHVARIDTSVHHDNPGAERFYRRLGFQLLREERLSFLIPQ